MHLSSERDLLKSSESCQCLCHVLGSLYNKQSDRQRLSDCQIYHGTNRKEVMSDVGFTEAREKE